LYLAEGKEPAGLVVFYLADGSFVATEAKTGFLFAARPFLATSRMWLSENLLADGLKPQHRLSEGDCRSCDLI